MNRINRKVEYSLMALQYMSNKFSGSLVSAKEVSASSGSPFDATSRVMQLMAQKGILKSEQGARGGYLLVQDLSKISLFDLIESVTGPMAIVKCLEPNGPACEIDSFCNVKRPLFELNNRLIGFYKEISLRELLSFQEPKPSLSGQEINVGSDA